MSVAKTTVEPKQLLCSLPDAWNSINVGQTTFWELQRAGEIEVVKIGRRVLVVVQSLEDYVQRLREASRSQTSETAGD